MNWLLVCWNYQMWNLWLRTAAVFPNQSWQGQEQWLSQCQAGDITCTVKIPLMPNPGLQSAKVALISSSIYRTDGLQGLRFTAWCSTAHYKTHLKEKGFSSLCLTFFSTCMRLIQSLPQLQLCQLQTPQLTLGCVFLLPVPRSGRGVAKADSFYKSYITGSCFTSRLAWEAANWFWDTFLCLVPLGSFKWSSTREDWICSCNISANQV